MLQLGRRKGERKGGIEREKRGIEREKRGDREGEKLGRVCVGGITKWSCGIGTVTRKKIIFFKFKKLIKKRKKKKFCTS